MKVLMVLPAFYDGLHPQKTINGVAVVVDELRRCFSDDIEVSVFQTRCYVSGARIEDVNILDSRFLAILKKFRIAFLKDTKAKSLKAFLREVHARTISAYFEDILAGGYDVIHLHDLSNANVEIIKKCMAKNVACIATMHFYYGNTYFNMTEAALNGLRLEKEIIEGTSIPITTVSTGIKKAICRDHAGVDPERISVICDGMKLKHAEPAPCPVRSGKKAFLCIGRISQRKNQIQLLRALRLLPAEARERCKVLFIGQDLMNGELQRQIEEYGLSDAAEYIGVVAHEDMRTYYRNAFAVISTPLNEAFGMTFLEGFSYGLPAAIPDDIYAAEDLYSQDAVEMIRGREDQDIADAITRMLDKTWDPEKILRHAQKFDMKNIAKEYEKAYRKCAGSMLK